MAQTGDLNNDDIEQNYLREASTHEIVILAPNAARGHPRYLQVFQWHLGGLDCTLSIMNTDREDLAWEIEIRSLFGERWYRRVLHVDDVACAGRRASWVAGSDPPLLELGRLYEIEVTLLRYNVHGDELTAWPGRPARMYCDTVQTCLG